MTAKFYVNVNRQTIDRNTKNGTDDPPIRVTKGKSGDGVYCHEVELPAGSRVIYSPQGKILKCGARLVIECPTEPVMVR